MQCTLTQIVISTRYSHARNKNAFVFSITTRFNIKLNLYESVKVYNRKQLSVLTNIKYAHETHTYRNCVYKYTNIIQYKYDVQNSAFYKYQIISTIYIGVAVDVIYYSCICI